MNNHSLPTIVHFTSGDLWAGAEMQVFTLATSSQQSFRIVAILLNEGLLADRLRNSGIEVHVVDEQQHGFLATVKRVKQILKTSAADLLHTHGYKENVIGALAASLCRIPSIRTAHGDNEFRIRILSPKQSLPALMDTLTGRYLQKKIVAVSTELAEKLKQQYPQKKITMIANGINLESISTNLPPADDIPIDNTQFKLAFVGRLVALKRVELIIEGFALLRQQYGTQYQLYIVGEGPEQQVLEQQTKQLNLTDCVHFLGHRSDVHQVMRSMDALIMASDHEGLPMTVLEAVALEVPVISHAVGAIPEVLDHGRCGYLFREQTPEALAQAIRHCETNADQSTLTQQALEHLAAHYSHKINADSYAALYREILAIA